MIRGAKQIMPRKKIPNPIAWVAILGLFVSLVSCATNPVTGETQLMLLSEPQEIELGRQTDSQIVKEYGIYKNPSLTSYIADLGKRLGRLSHRPALAYHFKILDSSVVNAFAVPGGYVYFTRGILAYLNTEAELAGVMGHEIGHITARHSAQQYSKAQLAQVGLGAGMILSDIFRDFSNLIQAGVGMLFLKFSRDNERQADDLGVEYSSRAGYDAAHMANFFKTLERMNPKKDQSGLPDWFSTHPNPVDRIGAVQRKAREWQRELGLKNLKANRDQYLKHIDGLVFGEDPREGFVEHHIFYHPLLRFQFPAPSKWTLQNTRTMVRMAAPKEKALLIFTLSPNGSPEEAARGFVRQSGARVADSGRTKINGLPAVWLTGSLNTRQGALGVMAYFIQKENQVFLFYGFCGADRFNGYVPTFEATIKGFKNLTDPKKINVNPDRIRTVPAPRSASMRQVLEAPGAPRAKRDEWAIMNGMRLEEQIRSGTLVKIIRKGRVY